jgi:DNA-binding transcriptional MerR regulator
MPLDSGVDSRLYAEHGSNKAVRQTARIGQVARETGLSIDTIRFYEKQGLLKHSGRTEGGFRVFGPDQIKALKFVRKAQELGFSLGEIRELLILQADDVPACSHVKELLGHKLAGVQQKIQELRTLEHGLKIALRKCERDLETVGPRRERRCPVLEEISRAARE